MQSQFAGLPEGSLNPVTASAEELLDLALKFSLGRGVALNVVEAHKWLNLAAMKGSKAALQYRSELAREMSASQVAEALRQARAWLTLH
jgi:uncharacterized protein